MHRHGYKGRKLHRETDQRLALIKGLADSLVLNERINTTHAKAKEVLPYLEKLITKAKLKDLHNRRQVIAGLQTLNAANKLVDEIAPKLTKRNSGYLRIKKSTNRKGDNAPMSVIEFVDDLSTKTEAKSEVKEVTKP
ncbi:MAG: 50S ribosomal protein L17 [Candidatus Saccharimonadales bacterium]